MKLIVITVSLLAVSACATHDANDHYPSRTKNHAHPWDKGRSYQGPGPD
ncbi:MAG: hypothetical protein M0Q44_17515 [Methylobacter sp.]|jgi:hypothetical protein|nr:hypothetical protein [Methylobacter sp.]